jgi:hypothetical protein
MDKDGFNPGLPGIVVVFKQDINPLNKCHWGQSPEDRVTVPNGDIGDGPEQIYPFQQTRYS